MAYLETSYHSEYMTFFAGKASAVSGRILDVLRSKRGLSSLSLTTVFLGTVNAAVPNPSHTTTPSVYYVANEGSDSNDGLSQSRPFRTIAKVNTITPLLLPGDQVLLHAGERFTDDFIRCQNLVIANNLTTLTNTPPTCSGTSAAPITFGRYGAGVDPVIDAADQLVGLVWRPLGNGVYSTPLATLPQKLYVDTLAEAPQLIPVPNFVGVYDSSGQTTYQPQDSVLVETTGTYAMNGSNTPQGATIGGLGTGGAWGGPYTTNATVPGQTGQAFIPTNTGVENVMAIGGGSVYLTLTGGTQFPDTFTFTSTGGGSVGGVACDVRGSIHASNGLPQNSITYTANHGCQTVPAINVSVSSGTGIHFFGRVNGGSYYYASASQNGALANELYVHLPDGSDPSTHTFYATHRSYGVLLRSVNNVVVSHIQLAHQLKSGVLSYPFTNSTLTGQYWTNENIHVNHVTCWNTGDTVNDTLGWQNGLSRTATLEACVVLRASGEDNPHFVRGNAIADSWSGLIDVYYGVRGESLHANFFVSGVDGTTSVNGVNSSYPVVQYSYGRSHNAACIRYGTVAIHVPPTSLNKGGLVTNNECTDNANGNIFFGATEGGRVAYNFIHNSLGEGIQAGGNSTSVADPTSPEAQLFDHNVISNLGYSASTALYNGIDVNNGNEGPSFPYSSHLHIFNNTIFNAAAACITLEANIVATHVHDNACVQNASYFPSGFICPLCVSTTNYAAGIYVRMASLQYPVPMDWYNNAWQGQGLPSTWGIYNLQNVGANRGSCGNLTSFVRVYNSDADIDPTSLCVVGANLNNPTQNDVTLPAASQLRGTGTSGRDIGALAFGTSLFPVGPRAQ